MTPPAIGGNLLGLLKFEDYKRQLPAPTRLCRLQRAGFSARAMLRESEGNRFDRLRVIQDGKTFRFVQNDYSYAMPIEGQQVTGLFALPSIPASTPEAVATGHLDQ